MKDVYCRERMKRFGMIDSDQCEICGACETVQHQLFECPNATKIRMYASQIERELDINDLYGLIEVGKVQNHEILKSLIIKYLIQIDRSKSLTFETFNEQYQLYSRIHGRPHE